MNKSQVGSLVLISTVSIFSLGTELEPERNLPQPQAQSRGGHKNLQVLPKDTGRQRLGNLMLDFLTGLGLPRRAGEGCLHCHVGSLDVPRAEWDYASDAKPAKLKARAMLKMTREINLTHLKQLPGREKHALQVSCYTCHSGRLNPAPLEAVLRAEFDTGGIGALESTYTQLHQEYYAGDAYDFRAETLLQLGDELAKQDEFEAGIRVHRLNAEHSDDPAALGGEILLLMQEALEGDGIEGMLQAYHGLKEEHPKEAFQPSLLPRLSWSLYRSGAKPAGFRLFELNYSEHPNSFQGTEDLAYGCDDMGDPKRAMELAEAWIAKHPEHKSGLQLLAELQR